MSTIDLNSPPPDHVFSISVDRQESTAERNVRLFKEVAIFLVALGFVVAIATVSVLSAAAGGLVGYLVKK